ncbi:uncharacterized protein METZ01_LOCUS80816 [marine metagenome]|jgi:hypothetical protein|uniref:Sulfotransferase family protein n=1 Tax=marine metagenome TaxID=408172 RepID=A0A381UIE8_9ZZZZ
MYAFRQRDDTTVFDEPIYAHYLRVTGREHPGRDEVLTSQDPDGEAVVRDLILGEHPTPVVFFKQMAQHVVQLDRAFLGRCRNLLLIRDPERVITSFAKNVPDVNVADTGLPIQVELLESILADGGDPIVIDSTALLAAPEAVLRTLCGRLGLAFDPGMLSWPAGPKPEDGVWAEHWYASTHRSTGFESGHPSTEPAPEHLRGVVAEARPLYERLSEFALDA